MRYNNLIEALKGAAGGRSGITFIEGGDSEIRLSYNELYIRAQEILHVLQKRGIRAGNEVVFQVEDNRTFVIYFWACILGGMIPVPLTIGKTDDHRQKLFNVWRQLAHPYLVTDMESFRRIGEFAAAKELQDIYAAMMTGCIDCSQLPEPGHTGQIFGAGPQDIAFVQFSSGSTGNPKGVVLTHKNLLTNIRAISKTARYTAHDSMLSWMPLTHDMGLIGFHLNPTCCGMDHYLMPPGLFIRRPALWLDKATGHAVTILSSPNFGYEYLLKHCDLLSGDHRWDLSSVRILYNGAEPVSEALCRKFLEALKPFKLKSRAMCPVYGLAEASLAVTISGMRDEVSAVSLDRNRLNTDDRIRMLPPGKNTVTFVNVGKPVNDCQLMIADEEDRALAAGRIGQILIKGDNVTAGYYRNAAETKKVINSGGWLRTGDLGFMMDGKLYVTGRIKDIFFINGQNYYPHDLERIAEEVPGVELNKIAITGFFNASLQKEEVAAFLIHRGDIESFIPLAKQVRSHINQHAGVLIDKLIPVQEMPRTTSGKLQRFMLLERLKMGGFKAVDERVQFLLQGAGQSNAVMPENSDEQRLLKIWKEICKAEDIGITHRFFDIGGNSLKAAEAVMMIRKEFQVDMKVDMIYRCPTVREMAVELGGLQKKDYCPIPPAPPAEYYPLTSAQQRLYFTWASDKASLAYNIPLAFAVTGTVEAGRLEDALLRLVARHDVLRSSFHLSGKEPMCRVASSTPFHLTSMTCRREDIDGSLTALVRPFDLSLAPLFRAVLLDISETEHYLFLDFHHIIYDGISVYLFIEELQKLYVGYALPEQPVGFRDYAVWERTSISPERMRELQHHWAGSFQGGLPVLEMPLDHPRPVVSGWKGARLSRTIGEAQVSALRRLAQDRHSTLHVLVLTLYYILLSKYTGQQDIAIGIPVAGRNHPDLLAMHGMFVNNLVIRIQGQDEQRFSQLLESINGITGEALRHQDMPFAALLELTPEKRDAGRSPLFDTMLVYQNIGSLQSYEGGLTLSGHFFDPGTSKFDISLEVVEDTDKLRCTFEYSTELFEEETIGRLVDHFFNILNRAIEDPEIMVAHIQPLSGEELDAYVTRFNATERDYPKDRTIHQLFSRQAELTPDVTAIEYGAETMSFSQLDERSHRLAALLRQKGVVPNVSVAILLHRSPALIVSILAVLKAGGCYLPIEPGAPVDRIRYMAANSQCRILIASGRTMAGLPGKSDFHVEVINYDRLDLMAMAYSPVEYISNPHNLAYVMYTSGTTGQPKGVMIEHTSLVNYITWAADLYVRHEPASFPLHTSIAFDLTVTSIFTPLTTGNKMVIYDDLQQELVIQRVIQDNRVDIVKLTPSHLRLLLDNNFQMPGSGSRIKRFIVGGEKLETNLAEAIWRLFKGQVEIYNEYGPTEATVGCMIYLFRPGSDRASVPIGVPAANTRVYLLDRHLLPVAMGVSGELYIGGDGVARGYLFNGEMTSARFIPDPFAEGRRMYKTGDTARRLTDGNIEYIGRYDQQVKINGYRIELSDIETHLKEYEGISEAFVIVRANLKGKDSLYAYYVPQRRNSGPIEPSAIRNYLAGKLPHYMIPVQFIAIDHIPLTANGKIDHSALPQTSVNESPEGGSEVMSEVEELSVKVWEDVLGVKGISVTDNFFEVGGDSIRAVQIASALAAKGVLLHVRDILTYHTIRLISGHAQLEKDKSDPNQQEAQDGERGLLPIESWFFGRNLKNEHYFNQSVLVKWHGMPDRHLLERTLSMLIAHHDGLRMNYDREKNVMFYNNRHLDQPLKIEEKILPAGGLVEFQQACRKIKGGFDIDQGLLIKAAVLKEQGTADRLLLTAHHLVIDGLSWRILLEDLLEVYSALEKGEPAGLRPKTASLQRWEGALRAYAATEDARVEEAYWREIANTSFALPLDQEPGDWTVQNMEVQSRTLSEEQSDYLLKGANLVYRTDVPILLQTALLMTLKEWTGGDTVVVYQENHGRYLQGLDVSRTTGWFTAMYPAKLSVGEGDAGRQIRKIKEDLRSIPNHGIGYGLCKYMAHKQPWQKKDPVEILFNYLGQFGKELDNHLFSYVPSSGADDSASSNTLTAKLELQCIVVAGLMQFQMRYNRNAHYGATISWLMDRFFNHIDIVLDHIRSQSSIHFTPSDFSSAHLDQEELDTLFN